MAIISSNIGDNDFSFRKKELRLVDSKIIPEEKRNNNLNLARPRNLKDFGRAEFKFLLVFSSAIVLESTILNSFRERGLLDSSKLEEIIAIMKG